MNQPNPLINYLRKPEIYITLPSAGRWWPAQSIEIPENGELPVLPMTGHDDLMMRNADGLMNGATTVSVIQNCVPNIKNAWDAPSIDIEYLFVAIRIASYGHEMEMQGKCSKCGEFTNYAVDLRVLLQNIQIPNFDHPCSIGELIFMLKPPSFKVTNLAAQEIFEQQRAILTVQNQDLLFEQKEEILRKSLAKLTEITVSRMFEHVDYVMLPNGTKVFDKKFISEFIDNASRKDFNLIKKSIEDINNQYRTPMIPFKCSSCGHEDQSKFEFDPANFFAADSST